MASDVTTNRNDRIARLLLLVAAIGAAFSWVDALGSAFDEPSQQVTMAVHDMLSFPVYAGLFLLLVWFPRRLPGIWELLIVQKLAMGILGFTAIAGEPDASLVGGADLVLAGILAVAYVLARGHEAWNTVRA